MGKAIFKKIAVILMPIIILSGCSSNKLSSNKNDSANADKKIYRSTVEDTIKSFYNSEVSKDAKYLSEFYLNSSVADTDVIKKMMTAYKVKKQDILKLYNIKNHGNYAIVTCAYNTYFEGIDNPRPDIEIVALVKKEGFWYIVNDYSKISDDDMKWINDTGAQEKALVTENKEIEQILQQNDDFNKANETFMENGEKAYNQTQNGQS